MKRYCLIKGVERVNVLVPASLANGPDGIRFYGKQRKAAKEGGNPKLKMAPQSFDCVEQLVEYTPLVANHVRKGRLVKAGKPFQAEDFKHAIAAKGKKAKPAPKAEAKNQLKIEENTDAKPASKGGDK